MDNEPNKKDQDKIVDLAIKRAQHNAKKEKKKFEFTDILGYILPLIALGFVVSYYLFPEYRSSSDVEGSLDDKQSFISNSIDGS